MSAPGIRTITIGLTVMLVSVSAAMHLGACGFGGLLLCLVGVLIGSNLIAAGIRIADGPAPNPPMVPMVFGGARALVVFLRRNATVVGLAMVSFALTVVSGEEDPVLCFGMFALLLLGLTLINVGAHAE